MPILRSALTKRLVLANIPEYKLSEIKRSLIKALPGFSFTFDNLRAAFKNIMKRDPSTGEVEVIADNISGNTNFMLSSNEFKLKNLPVRLVEEFTEELRKQTKRDLDWTYFIRVKTQLCEIAFIEGAGWDLSLVLDNAQCIAKSLGLEVYAQSGTNSLNVTLP